MIPSDTSLRNNLVGLAAMLAVTAAIVAWQGELDLDLALVALLLATAIPIAALDLVRLRVHTRPSTGLAGPRRPIDPGRVATKVLGGCAAVGLVLGVYALAPEYQGEFYDHWYRFLRVYLPIGLVVGVGYTAALDGWLVEPRDAYWHLGAWLTGRGADVDRSRVWDLLRTWVIKGYFAPLMYTYAIRDVVDLRAVVASDRVWFLYAFDGLWNLGFLVDVVFPTVGYLVTFRPLDTHVRSAEPTMRGWVVALVCYQPFFDLVSRQYLKYEGGFFWGNWLDPYPPVKWAWGAVILALLFVFVGSTVAFGLRFSNLTHRGVVTTGFYRWTRHPAYVSKCASYWLIFVPFVPRGSAYEVVRDCTWLGALCVVYWLRAKTEERHLSRDPAYVAYATAMNDRSVFAPLGRWFPALRYQPPTG